MATITDVTTRAQAEAPTCCGQPMQVTNLGDPGGHVQYQCPTCLTRGQGRDSEYIGREINNGTLKPVNQQQGSPSMPRPASTATAVDHEHNAAVLKRLLTDITGVLHRGTDTVNSLNRGNGILVAQVASAGEFAVATEQTSQSKIALDETAGLTAGMDEHLGAMSSAVGEAELAAVAAIAGLRVVDEAHDALLQAGAGTKAAAPARDGA